MQIPLTRPVLDQEEEHLVVETLRTGWLTQGGRVEEFEHLVSAAVGAPFAVACSSCTTALQVALKVAEIGPEDEVIVPSFSFIATANAVRHVGATPVFADIDLASYNLDPKDVEARITSRTRALLPVDQFGMPAETEAFQALAARHGLAIVEDAACALGSRSRGKPVGGQAELACFSFHPRKLITTGEGGMITTVREEYAERARRLISHGASVSDLTKHRATSMVIERYSEVGYNFRMTNLQGAIGVAQMEKLDWILKRRRALGERYTAAFRLVPAIIPPKVPPDAEPNYQTYVLRLTEACPRSRNQMVEDLLARGIAARPGIQPIHLEPCYAESGPRLPNTELAAATTLIIPLFPQMTETEQDYVIESVLALVGGQ